MKRLRMFGAIVAVGCITIGCIGTGDNSQNEESSDSKLKYSPLVNEVTVVELKRQDFPMQLLSNGKLCASSKAPIFFREAGVVREICVRNGQRVSKGTVIAILEDNAQKSALESAGIELDRATLDLQDALVGLGYPVADQDKVPEDIMKMASIRSGYSAAKNSYEKARTALEHTVLKAPYSGMVADLKFKAWNTVSGAEPFCTVIGNDGFDVEFTILESEYPFVENGQRVRISQFGGQPDECVNGCITAINPSVDKNGQIGVRAHLAAGPRMLDGMNVRVAVDKILEKQLVVPKKAVVIRDGLEVLFRYNERGTADWVYVHTLKANADSYAVVANEERAATLNEGDLIIVSGNLNLADGSNVSLKR